MIQLIALLKLIPMKFLGGAAVMVGVLLLWEYGESKVNYYRGLETKNSNLVKALEEEQLEVMRKANLLQDSRESEEKHRIKARAEITQADMREKRLKRIEAEKKDLAQLLTECRVSTETLRK